MTEPKKTEGHAPMPEDAARNNLHSKSNSTTNKSEKATRKKAKPRRNRVIGDRYLKAFCRRIAAAGLALRSTATDTQKATLPKVLQFLGDTGLNTYEGQALGYLRIATRIKELKDVWDIVTVREDVMGPDGLTHINVGRYILQGKKQPAQMDLGLGAP